MDTNTLRRYLVRKASKIKMRDYTNGTHETLTLKEYVNNCMTLTGINSPNILNIKKTVDWNYI